MRNEKENSIEMRLLSKINHTLLEPLIIFHYCVIWLCASCLVVILESILKVLSARVKHVFKCPERSLGFLNIYIKLSSAIVHFLFLHIFEHHH